MRTCKTLCFAASIAAGRAGTAWAQSCGGCAPPPPVGGGGAERSWLATGEMVARLSQVYEVRDRSYKHGDRVANDFGESLFVSRTALDVRAGVADDWTADVTLTYAHYTYRVKPPGGERSTLRFRGPGDTFVSLGRRIDLGGEAPSPHAPGGIPGPTLALWGGLALPTGTPERPNPSIVTRDVSVSNLQTGTGTVDPVVRARLEWPLAPLTLFAEAAARVPVSENRYRYRTGDAETLAVGAGATIAPRVSASFSVTGQRVARDRFDGREVGVGGARWIHLVPGVAWRMTDAVALDVSVRLPVFRHTETKLSDSGAVFEAGLTVRF